MGAIEDVRKAFPDLVAPELKSVEVRSGRDESRIRDEMTRNLLSAKLDALSAKMDAQYASIMNALDLSRCVESLAR
jgi:hypothetical protein